MIYSQNFNAEKNKISEEIISRNIFLEKLININHRTHVFNDGQVKTLVDIVGKNKKYLHKLASNEFEIVIVGLEKAGKSTFANALIESNILPSAPERCTFTSTRLVSGDNKAKVEFYSADEFNKIFQTLLQEIDYPDAVNESFKTLDPVVFEKYFSGLDSSNHSLYKNHVGKTDQEIKDILKCRNKLMLGEKAREFSGDDLEGEIFQAFIKGENKGDDTSKPRSVKNVVIESSKLKQLESAVIYDVPGFDSPTKIHIRQTEERLKQADAIILVTNVGRNPSIQGTSLNVINKNSDEDGIPLRDKLFVFGNQFDSANSFEEAIGNKAILIKDVEKYKIGERKRVFVGSALKYLSDKGLWLDAFETKFKIDDGIDDIRNELIKYYETERFEILKRKIDTNRDALYELFDHILRVSDLSENSNFIEDEKGRITRETQKSIEKSIKGDLSKFKLELKDSISKEKYFSKKFYESVSHVDYFAFIDETLFDDVRAKVSDSVTTEVPCESINQEIRRELHKNFLVNYSNLILNLTNEKSLEIEVMLLRKLTAAVVGSADSPLFSEVEIEVKKMIKNVTSNIAHDENKFSYLVERFSRDIFDVLILSPLYSSDRLGKFKEAISEFAYLDNFYHSACGSELTSVLLAGEKNSGGVIRNFSERNKQALDTINRLLPMVKELQGLKSLINAGSPVNVNAIVQGFSVLTTILQESEKKFGDLSEPDISKYTNSNSRSKTQDDVISEINNDIVNLKEVLQVAVVPATNLDLAFYNSIDKQIKVLIDALDNSESESFYVFNDFIARIVNKMKKSEFDNINEKVEAYKLKKEVLKEIREALKSI